MWIVYCYKNLIMFFAYSLLRVIGELAPALSATINITGDLVDFVVVHMGNDRWANIYPLSYQIKSLSQPHSQASLLPVPMEWERTWEWGWCWTSMDCWPAWQDSKGRGEAEKRERDSLFPFHFFLPYPSPSFLWACHTGYMDIFCRNT